MSEKPCGAYFFAFFEKFVAPILTSRGYVGLSIATLLSQHHKVIAVDIVPEKVELINNKKSPIQDSYIEKYLAEKELNLTATLDAKEAYSDADFVVIAAPTNYDSKKNFFDTAVLLRVFRSENHINIPASGLQFVVVIFEIDVAFVLCGSSRKQLFLLRKLWKIRWYGNGR